MREYGGREKFGWWGSCKVTEANREWFQLEAGQENNPKIPEWLAEAVLVLKYWQESELLEQLIAQVQVGVVLRKLRPGAN